MPRNQKPKTPAISIIYIVRNLYAIPLSFFIIFFLALILTAPSPAFSEPYNFALVLSGGGSRGLAQVGVLKALEEEGLRPDLIVSTSMGAIVGGLYACGYSPNEIHEITKSIDWGRALSNVSARQTLFVSQKANPKGYLFDIRLGDNFRPILPNAISSGQIFYDELSGRMLPALHRAELDFKKLPVSLRVVATDLLTGNREVFSGGSLITAIRASSSVPLAFAPVFIDGKLLVDGGLTANIPVQAAKEEGAVMIVAVDVTSPLSKREELENPVRLMEQVVSIGVERNKAEDLTLADFVITPRLPGFSNTDFSRIDVLIERGYEAARAVIPDIKAKINSNITSPINTDATKDTANPRVESSPKTTVRADSVIIPVISEVQLFGNEKTSNRLLLTASGIKPGGALDVKAVERAIRSLHSTELFENVRVETEPEARVNIHVDEKKFWRVKGGLRYDEYHLGEFFIEPGYDNLFGHGIAGALHLQYGMRREKYALEFSTNQLFSANRAGSADLQLFTARERIYSRTAYPRENELPDSVVIDDVVLGKSGVSFVVGGQIAKSTSIEAGVKMEKFQLLQSNRGIFDHDLGFGFRNSLPYFMLRLNVDTRDAVPFTSSGQRHIVTAGVAGDAVGLGGVGVEEFMKIDGSFNYYFTLARRHTFHTQAIFGWTSAALPEVEKFYLGGAIPEQSYRDAEMYNIIPFMGMKTRSVSSEVFGLAHLEYRLTLRRNFYLAAALDWARLWDYEEFTSRDPDSDFTPKNPLGAGVGLAYRTPVGPIRFTYGQLIPNREDKDAKSEPVFYFSAGYDF